MEETLKTLRRIYYVILVISAALVVFVLTPLRTTKYRDALRELNAVRAVPWYELRSFQERAAKDVTYYTITNDTVYWRPIVEIVWNDLFPQGMAVSEQRTAATKFHFQPFGHPSTLEQINDEVTRRLPVIVEPIYSDREADDFRRLITERCSRPGLHTFDATERRMLQPLLNPRMHPHASPSYWVTLDATADLEGRPKCEFHVQAEEYDSRNEYSRRGKYTLHLELPNGHGLLLTIPTELFVPSWYPSKWLADTADTTGILFDSDGIFLPNVRYFWRDLADRTPEDAVFFLETQLAANEQKISFLGLSLDERIAVVIGPIFLLLALLYMRVYVTHLLRIAPLDESALVREYPWPLLFPRATGVCLSVLVLIILPGVCGVLMVFRATTLESGRATTVLVAITTTLCVGSGMSVYRQLHRLRSQQA
jgi:hypothetical protein